jgi:D-alanyl-D-alanine dipeptidase
LLPVTAAFFLAACATKKDTVDTPRFPLEEIEEYPGLRVELMYKRADNITGKSLYPRNFKAYVLPSVKNLLHRVVDKLKPMGYGLTIVDAWRPPVSAAYLWNEAVRQNLREFFAPPDMSMHTRGAAVDVTLHLLKSPEIELEMPSAVDSTDPITYHSDAAKRNALLLRTTMRSEGFSGHPKEWWHFEHSPSSHSPIVQNPRQHGGKVYKDGIVYVPQRNGTPSHKDR